MYKTLTLALVLAAAASTTFASIAPQDVTRRKTDYLVRWADEWRSSGYNMVPNEKEWKWDEYDPTWYGALAAMKLKRSPAEIEKANEYFSRMTEGGTMRGAEAAHTLYLFKDDRDLNEAARKRLWELVVETPAPKKINPSPWDFDTTENIAPMGYAWFLLSAQLRGDKVAAEEMAAQACRYIDEHFRLGFIEFYSPCYLEKDAGSLMMFVQWAESPRLRRKARALLDLMFAEYAANSFDQVHATPCMRAYGYNVIGPDQELGHNERRDFSCSGIYSMGYVLFGQGKMFNYGVLGTPVLVTTDYVPPQIVLDIAAADHGTFVFRASKPGLNLSHFRPPPPVYRPPLSARVYCYHTPEFVLASTQEVNYRHAGIRYNPVNSVLFCKGDPRKVILTELVFEPGRENWLVPADLAQHGRVAIGKGVAGLAYFAKDLFEETVEESGWIFVRDGGTFAAYRVVDGGYKWRNIKSWSVFGDYIEFSKKDSPFILHVAAASEYRGDFAAFRKDVADNPIVRTRTGVRYTTSGDSAFSLELRPGKPVPKKGPVDIARYFGRLPLLNGEEMRLDDYPGIECPFIHQAPDSPHAEIRLGERRMRIGVGP